MASPYPVSLLAELGPEGDLALCLAPGLLVKNVARIEGRAVQVERHSRIDVRRILHAVQAHGIWNFVYILMIFIYYIRPHERSQRGR